MARFDTSSEAGLSALKSLEARLDDHTRTEEALESPRDEVVEALDWLASRQRVRGYWGEEQEGTTALAMIALKLWSERPDTAAGAMARAAVDDDALSDGAAWLAEQARDGRWETPWYSAIAIRAMRLADFRSPVLEEGQAYLEALDPANDQEWCDRVHHAAQILLALHELDPDHSAIPAWTDCIKRNLESRDGPYVCGQAVHALVSCTTTPASELPVIDDIREYLENTPLSKSAFMNYAPALLALALSEESADDLVTAKANELFSKRERGSWYRDAEMTAWALLALHSVHSLTQIVVDKGTFNSAFATAYAAIPAEQRKLRRLAAAYGAGLVVVTAAIVAALLWGPDDSLVVGELGIGVVGGPVAFLLIRALYALVR